jgi:hypothetical protein
MTLLGIPLGQGSGRARYAEAMSRYNSGALSAPQLEAYRIASAEDFLGPEVELEKGPALPLTPTIQTEKNQP